MTTQSLPGTARKGKKGYRAMRGFTVLELLIITVVIAVIASIALPNYVTAKKSANETSAINSMRALVVAEENYRTAKGGASGYTDLNGLKASGHLNEHLSLGAMSGYTFVFQGSATANTFAFKAIPQTNGGDRRFYVDQTGVLRVGDTNAINASSPALD